ncbi:acetyl-CoA synthetase-like protein [Violaceomyces palustris]|uniref:Acetyl-CoA synthetase-like protein n=1 Tax=Violaceomyces palustris TaxID=1673888 RepID=A0ACD0P436_9BASI|nr:acetyl-CoA synthetase-like protein [Violaceomyces palustris]
MWASHKLGAVVSAANPAFQPSELSYQLEAAQASVLFLGEDPATLRTGLEAAAKAGIPKEKIVIIQSPTTLKEYMAKNYGNGGKPQKKIQGAWTLAGLIQEGREHVAAHGPASMEKGRCRLDPGQGKKKLCLLSFSSGTTGLPKGVAIQHSAPVANVLQAMAFNQVGSKIGVAEGRFRPGRDVALGILPQFHIYGLIIGTHFVFYAGITNVIMPKFRGIEAMIKSVIKYRISLWWLVPPQVVLLCKDPSVKPYIEELRKVARFVMVGAAPLSDDLSKQFMKVLPGIDWGQGYGMTETCTVTTMHPTGMPAVLGSAGRIFSNTEAKVVDSQGNEVGYDQPGELWVRGPQMTLGYSNNAKATEEMFLPDGFVRTGDEVVINRAGDVFIVDRLKELIKVKGFQVAPAELEGFLLDHPDVSDCGVIGLADEASGELPFAFIALSEQGKARRGKDGDEAVKKSIMKFVADNKIKYKHLAGVEFIDAIPKTASGKILRRNMRDLAKKLDLKAIPPSAAKSRL